MTLVEFLLARIAENAARAVEDPPHWWDCKALDVYYGTLDPKGCNCGLPARVLAECEAKRAIVSHHEVWQTTIDRTPEGWTEQTATAYRMAMEWTVRHLGEVYTEHPDYDEGWRP